MALDGFEPLRRGEAGLFEEEFLTWRERATLRVVESEPQPPFDAVSGDNFPQGDQALGHFDSM